MTPRKHGNPCHHFQTPMAFLKTPLISCLTALHLSRLRSTAAFSLASKSSLQSKSPPFSIISSLSMSSSATQPLSVDPFCYRQFSEHEASATYSGAVFNISIEKFIKIVNERYSENSLKDGYAPFCKHLFLRNDFTDARVNVLPITKTNEGLLRTKYEARNEKEVCLCKRKYL